MNRRRKSLILFLVLTLLLSMIPFTNAAAATQTRPISSSSQGALFWRQITSYAPTKVNPVYNSQAEHVYGIGTTIGVNSSYTSTAGASVSLTAGVSSVFVEMSASMEVSNSVSYTTGTSISYQLCNHASGLYRIEHVFPRVKVKQQKVLSDGSGETIQWQRTINYAPKTNDAYHRLRRYGDLPEN